MTKKILSVAAGVALLLSSCNVVGNNVVNPSKERVKKEYKLESFDKIETATAINVVYTQDEKPQKVTLDVPRNMEEYVSLNVKDGELKVSFKKLNTIAGDHKTTLYVSGPAIRKFQTSSAGNVYIKNGVAYNGDVTIKSSSAGDIYADEPIKAKTLYVKASSAGNIKIAGAHVDLLGVESSSAGNIKVTDIQAVNVAAEASSAGSITLEGNCRSLEKEASSAGTIHCKKLKIRQ
ncbi:MAG: DUF2807 domain-containing protein [Prevotella sp.]|nr:DUF2807 domain-containing protein [Prevotella sp.]